MQEKSLLIKVLGDYPLIRVIDFFLTFQEFDYSLTEIAENAGVGWATLHKVFPALLKSEIVKPTRTIGRAKLFKLNLGSQIVQQLVYFDEVISSEFSEKATAVSQRPRLVHA